MKKTQRYRQRRSLWIKASIVVAALGPVSAHAGELPEGYWDARETQALLDKTAVVRLSAELAHLTAPEKAAMEKLVAAGQLIQNLYEEQIHPQALEARAAVIALHARSPSQATANLLTLYRLFRGPIATTLDNERVPFLPVSAGLPGRNVYPAGASRADLDAYLARFPDSRRQILGERTLVRAARPDNVAADSNVLSQHPELAALHPGLIQSMQSALKNGEPFYALPYSVAYAQTLMRVSAHVREAGELMQTTDPDFAAYLRLRARDLLTNDYEAGDAAWVRGRFGNLNAVIGSYESYDDSLYGLKTFFGLSILARNQERTARLQEALVHIQDIQDKLPCDCKRQLHRDFPVGVYDIVADFGQTRIANGASILPNDPDHARKYGRTVLIRYNIMSDPAVAARSQARFHAVIAPRFRSDLTARGELERTLGHEIGHYLGLDKTQDGRSLTEALQDHSLLFEELKADLASLFSAKVLHDAGYRSAASLREIYAAGVARLFQPVKPRPDDVMAMMGLIQWNYFVEQGLIDVAAQGTEVSIDYERYPQVVSALLAEVLQLQAAGRPAESRAFIDRYGYWNAQPHEALAQKVRAAPAQRFLLLRYNIIDADG